MFRAIVSSPHVARDAFVIAPHHPDRLRRPSVQGSHGAGERIQQAFAWNVFRTLELLSPPFWTRRLHARLGAEHFPATAQTLRVHLWKTLPLPPAQRIDGAQADVLVDVTIDTEHAVWTLMLSGEHDHRSIAHDDAAVDRVARVIDAAAWRAGARKHYVGMIDVQRTATSPGSLLRRRYARSRDSVRLRSGERWGEGARVDAVGALDWADLVEIVRDCEQARVLPTIERALARNVLTWIDRELDLTTITKGTADTAGR
jgi:hypothetical protein